jgi:hypothetical protein
MNRIVSKMRVDANQLRRQKHPFSLPARDILDSRPVCAKTAHSLAVEQTLPLGVNWLATK